MLGEPLLQLDETDSTNRVALEWNDAPHGAAVVARAQTSGRGRLGRSWESAADLGLYLSLILRVENSSAPLYSLASALGVALALENLTGASFRVKWPNDVLCLASSGAAQKVGGILCEGKAGKLVVGVGVNVNQSAAQLPPRPIFPASSLALQSGTWWEIDAVLQAVLNELNEVLPRLENAGWSVLRGEFERKCLGIGEVVRVKLEAETVIGVFDSVGENGALVLRTAGGLRPIIAGDVSYF
ncbi:biotin-[acetyl-CoA-carboxylase] ligase [Abditibacterium utsteinense]|uniref:biotin--[biotin carboxyl-carrier protein] ligase n=2 Tax=Abditibacterium utsteinense TaxID=1960156 RepID=A0A2S8SXM3_9BACT|nr:biotin-[acetyl-CoA-carboxylase] ligase [Abditibacterium utsteinense]